MNFLITGASGFVGKNLINHVLDLDTEDKYDLFVPEPFDDEFRSKLEGDSRFTTLVGDIIDYESMTKALSSSDVIIHLAAISDLPTSMEKPRFSFKVNCEGTANILEYARDNCRNAFIIVLSSAAIYGKPEYFPIDEKHPRNAVNPYAIQKQIVEQLCRCYIETFDLKIAILRPFNLYGPLQDTRFIIPTIIKQCIEKDAVALGNPNPIRNFTYIDDFVECLFLLIKNKEKVIGEVFNTGHPEEVTIKQLSRLIADLVGKGVDISFEKEKYRPSKLDINKLSCDYSKIKNLIAWEPKKSLKEGLAETIKFYK
ncbi:MAG: NAD-dependent epimerase/dehydratase family protein [Candidatus Hodarchaeota archaeon]